MSLKYRKFKPEDRTPVYRMFRESLWDYMLQHGLASPEDENDIDEYFRQQQNLYVHLEQTASEDWVAEDGTGNLVGRDRAHGVSQYLCQPLNLVPQSGRDSSVDNFTERFRTGDVDFCFDWFTCLWIDRDHSSGSQGHGCWC